MSAAAPRIWLTVVSLVAAACASGRASVAPDDVIDPGFVGPLRDAETSEWRVEPVGAGSSGGPTASTLVGPGKLTLANGEVIVVGGNTPGGTFCGGLAAPGETTTFDACVIIGVFEPGTNRAAWFSTESFRIDPENPDRFPAGQVDDVHGRNAILRFSAGHYALPISEDAALTGCGTGGDLAADPIDLPRATAHLAYADLGNEVIEIVCSYN